MSLPNFSEHQRKEIIKNPHLHLDKIQLGPTDYYYSTKGANSNGIYEWEFLSDESFKIVNLQELLNDTDFKNKLSAELFERRINIEVKDELSLSRALRELYEETLGYGLSFTLLNSDEFNKEFSYYNAKAKNRT